MKNPLFHHSTQLRLLSYIAKCNLTNYNYYLFCLKHQTLYIPKTLWQKLRSRVFIYRSFASNPLGGHQNPFNAAYLFLYLFNFALELFLTFLPTHNGRKNLNIETTQSFLSLPSSRLNTTLRILKSTEKHNHQLIDLHNFSVVDFFH